MSVASASSTLVAPVFNEDEWGQVINGPETYRAIAIGLLSAGSVAVGWSNGVDTHYDLIFSYGFIQGGDLQCGLGRGDLMVAIVRRGCFGFSVSSRSDLHYDYVREKLNVPDVDTALRLANLIMGVRKYL